jgi:hypothetical protein
MTAALLSCADREDIAGNHERHVDVSDDSAASEAHGSFFPLYDEPLKIVPGEYSVADDLVDVPLGTPVSTVTSGVFEVKVNGVRLFSIQNQRGFHDYVKACSGEDYAGFIEYEGLSFAYLPPGTWALGPQHAAVCPDGSIATIGQLFDSGSIASFDIWYQAGRSALQHDAPGARVFRLVMADGREGVLVAPLSDRFASRSWVAWPEGRGIITVDARDMPLSEVLRIAEGVRCVSC